jgi:hypothetical protein
MGEMSLMVHINVVEIDLNKFHHYDRITNETINVLSKFVQILHNFQHWQQFVNFHIMYQLIVSSSNQISKKIIGCFYNKRLILR